MRSVHSWTEESAHIGVTGLTERVRVLHVTDAHLNLIDDRDAERRAAFDEKTEKLLSLPAREPFEKVMAEAANVDLIALTGDILQFPSQANIEAVRASLTRDKRPALFTCGNHDWHFAPLPRAEEVRQAWRPALEPLTGPEPACRSLEFKGLRFVAIDNSTYQVSSEQLDFVRQELDCGEPVVLLMHIPLSLPVLREDAIDVWGAPILIADPDWGEPSRTGWAAGTDTPETLAFAEAVSHSPNVSAVLTGHLHFTHADALPGGAVQYVTEPAFNEGRRLVEFVPHA